MEHISKLIPVDVLLCAFQRHVFQDPELGFFYQTLIPGIPHPLNIIYDCTGHPVKVMIGVDVVVYSIPFVDLTKLKLNHIGFDDGG